MWRNIALLSLILWVSTIGYLSYQFIYGNAQKVDDRIEISLAPLERELVLGEMRLLLTGVQGIVEGLSEDNLKAVEKAARGNGMVMAQDINPALMTKLPLGFKEMGVEVHKAFDSLADKVHQMDQKKVLSELGSIMNSCIACHSNYKINEKI